MVAIKGLLLTIMAIITIPLNGDFLNDRSDFSSDYICQLKAYHLLKYYAQNIRILNMNSRCTADWECFSRHSETNKHVTQNLFNGTFMGIGHFIWEHIGPYLSFTMVLALISAMYYVFYLILVCVKDDST
jgi:hypothetical protein